MAAAVVTSPCVVNTTGVGGGEARIENPRIGVDDVVRLLQNGGTVDSAPCRLPDLTRARVYECLAYYEAQLTRIDPLIARPMADAGK